MTDPNTPITVIKTTHPENNMSTATDTNTASAADVRSWAKINGHTVGDRGRLSNELVDAYNASEQGQAKPFVRS